MTKYSFGGNLIFFLNTVQRWAKQTFWFIWICILLQVLTPLTELWLSNAVVSAIERQSDAAGLLRVILILGCVLVVCSMLERYGLGVVGTQSREICQEFSMLVSYKGLDMDYEDLGDSKVSVMYNEACQAIWTEHRFLPHAGEYLIMLGSGLIGVFSYIFILRHLPWYLIALIIAASALSFFCSGFGERERMKRQEKIGESTQKLDYLCNITRDAGNGKDIRLYHMYPWIHETFQDLNSLLKGEMKEVAKKTAAGGIIMTAMGILMEAAAYVLLTGMAMKGQISIAEYVFYIGAVLGMASWVQMIARSFQKVGMLNADVSCIRRYLDIPDRNAEKLNGSDEFSAADVIKKGLPCEIRFEHVSYRYPGAEREAISDLSFVIRKGERVALVGHNGEGKTTCVKLLCGLLQPTKGRIFINDIDVSAMRHEECFRLFSTVFQDIHVFPLSVRENISWLKSGGGGCPKTGKLCEKG